MVTAIGKATAFLAAFLVAMGTAPLRAAGFPERTVTIIVGFEPGGTTDRVSRYLAPKLSQKWGQAVVVENRPGADGTIAASFVARSRPDGHTMLMANNNFVAAPAVHKLNYDTVRSFAPITLIGTHGFALLVPQSLGVGNLNEFIKLVRASPGKYNWGTTGPSSAAGLTMSMLALEKGLDVAPLYYKGTGPIITALLGGEVQMSFNPIPVAAAQVQDNRLRALAVSTNVRAPELPDVPTVAEAAGIPGFEMGSWDGLLTPAGTPPDVVNKIHDDIVALIRTPEVTDYLIKDSTIIIANQPAEFGKFLAENVDRLATLLKKVGVAK